MTGHKGVPVEGSYANDNVSAYLAEADKAKIQGSKYSRLAFQRFLHHQKTVLEDDYSRLDNKDFARDFAQGLIKDIGFEFLRSRGLADEEAISSLLKEKNYEWIMNAATQKQVDDEGFKRMVIESGKKFEDDAVKIYGTLGKLNTMYDKKALGFKYLNDISGEEVYTLLGEPTLPEKVTKSMFDTLTLTQKMRLFEDHKEEGSLSPKKLEEILLAHGRAQN